MKRAWEMFKIGYAVVILLIMSLILLPTGFFDKNTPQARPPYSN